MPQPLSEDLKSRLMLVGIILCWGLTWPAMRTALHEVPPVSARVATTLIGSVIAITFALSRGTDLRSISGRELAHAFVSSVLNITSFGVLILFAQLSAMTSRVAVVAYTMPIWAAILSWIFLRERLTPARTLGLAMCIVGLAILLYPLVETGLPLGLVYALCAAWLWAAGTIYLKKVRISAPPLTFSSWQFIFAFVSSVALLPILEGGFHIWPIGLATALAVLFAGASGAGLAYILWFTVITRVPAMTASLAVLGSPFVGVVSSIVLLGEHPTTNDLVGFTLIFAAAVCVLLAPQAKAVAPARAEA